MDSEDLMGRVRALRERGYAPRQIARALGVPPATVAPLVRAIAAADQTGAGEGKLVGCWVSPGWSQELTVQGHPEWPDVDAADAGAQGLVSVLVTRQERYGRVRVRLAGRRLVPGSQGCDRPAGHERAPRGRVHPLLLRRLPGPTATSARGAGPSPGVRRRRVCAKPRLRAHPGLPGNHRAAGAVGRSERHRLRAPRQALLRPRPPRRCRSRPHHAGALRRAGQLPLRGPRIAAAGISSSAGRNRSVTPRGSRTPVPYRPAKNRPSAKVERRTMRELLEYV